VGVLLNRQWKLTIRDGALVRGRIIQARLLHHFSLHRDESAVLCK